MADKNVALKLGKTLREWRKKRNLTQEKLSELSGVSTEHIQRIEGKNPNSSRLDTIINLCRALKIEPSKFIKAFDE
jgi:transcriptional regulator with XRE-family HTH domain